MFVSSAGAAKRSILYATVAHTLTPLPSRSPNSPLFDMNVGAKPTPMAERFQDLIGNVDCSDIQT